jgi:hypothetical protein
MAAPHLKIGVDLDNTIACYDSVFSELAHKRNIQYPPGKSAKRAVRDTLRSKCGGELEWTKIQGEAYGPGMSNARPYPGSHDTLTGWFESGRTVVIISHRTRFPAFGKPHDLHAYARQWISRWLKDLPVKVFLEVNRSMKLRRIDSEGCDIFIDDLRDLLEDETFPDEVEKLWFLPEPSSLFTESHKRIKYVASWSEISNCVQSLSASRDCRRSKSFPDRRHGPWKGSASDLLSGLAFRSLNVSVKGSSVLKGGINNQVFKLITTDGSALIGKVYKRSLDDPRDRLMHETRFLRLLEKAGIDCVPRVLAVDEKNGIAIHTQVDGTPWPEDLTVPPHIWRQFSLFLERIQETVFLSGAAEIPLAAEAAMSLQEHIGWIQQRRDLWRARALEGDLQFATKRFVLEDIEAEYMKVAQSTISHPEFRKRIASNQLILTPSDFGLHNALVTPKGTVNFIDFEYAGWDDPLKTQIDFSLQPRYRAGRPEDLDFFKDRIAVADSRNQLVRDLLTLKWRYIILAAAN